jgi:hypothetical protein
MRWKQITEAAAPPENIDEALWWVMRYVSGSLNDPDWDYGEPNRLDINSAMELAGRYIGNRKTAGLPLSRYLVLDKNTAQKLIKSKMLPAYEHGFQSFTTGGIREAAEIGRDIHIGNTSGKVEVVVTIQPPSNEVLFGYEDVKSSRKPGVRDLRMQWGDWAHQGEVFVRVDQPIACSVRVLKKETLDEEAVFPIQFRIEREAVWANGEESKTECYFNAYDGETFAGSLHIAPSRDRRTFSVISVWVNPEYRRMKLATRLYNAAHEAGFQPITPDSNIKPDGVQFWDAHMRGKWKLGAKRPEMKWTPVALDETDEGGIPPVIYHGTSLRALLLIMARDGLVGSEDDNDGGGTFCSGEFSVAARYTPDHMYDGPDGAVLSLNAAAIRAAGFDILPYTYHSGDDGQEYIIGTMNHALRPIERFINEIIISSANHAVLIDMAKQSSTDCYVEDEWVDDIDGYHAALQSVAKMPMRII